MISIEYIKTNLKIYLPISRACRPGSQKPDKRSRTIDEDEVAQLEAALASARSQRYVYTARMILTVRT